MQIWVDADACEKQVGLQVMNAKRGLHGGRLVGAFLLVTWRSLVACTRGPEPLIAGLMRAFDQDGKELLLEIQPCYDCSSRGQRWQLTPVTHHGTSTTISPRPGTPGRWVPLSAEYRGEGSQKTLR